MEASKTVLYVGEPKISIQPHCHKRLVTWAETLWTLVIVIGQTIYQGPSHWVHSQIDWCCFSYSIRNSRVALLECLFAWKESISTPENKCVLHSEWKGNVEKDCGLGSILDVHVCLLVCRHKTLSQVSVACRFVFGWEIMLSIEKNQREDQEWSPMQFQWSVCLCLFSIL